MLYFIRSLGMLKEAEIIEQQMMLRAGVGATQAQQPDYSAQWAEYYRWWSRTFLFTSSLPLFRSLGKFHEAEAIEAQMKMKELDNVVASQAAIFWISVSWSNYLIILNLWNYRVKMFCCSWHFLCNDLFNSFHSTNLIVILPSEEQFVKLVNRNLSVMKFYRH